MKPSFKPAGYNSVSPYFVVNGADKLMTLLTTIFYAKELRKYQKPDGTIMHAEMQLDDSVLMFAEATAQYPPNNVMLHVYVADVDKTFQKAVDAGCEIVDKPKENTGDPDRRGSFKDFAGNFWSIGTQVKEE